MNVHFIAIGGSAMHNLALALYKKGASVTGSDDEIFEPARGRLLACGILPEKEGWFPEKLHPGLDAVILGMHAKADNPELIRAKELGIRIFSYPEFLYEHAKDKKRVVVGGSHGKTTITAMILHVLKAAGVDCDYMVGAQLEGFDVMVRLSETAPVMIFEGDEYLTSPIDRRPKFHLYKPDIAILSGIAWDHINVFPTFENYIDQFTRFIHLITLGGTLIFCSEDEELRRICPGIRKDITIIPYGTPEYTIHEGTTSLMNDDGPVPLEIFGKHNLMNLEGARLVCSQLGVNNEIFYRAIASFKGASNRLEKVAGNEKTFIYKDFAHAPSKVRATLLAVKEQFPGFRIVACLELHTYSSLNQEFLSHYEGTLDAAGRALVYFNPHAIKIKKLPPITKEMVIQGFQNPGVEVFTESGLLWERILAEKSDKTVFLFMSSGNYDGISLKELAGEIMSSCSSK